VGDPQQWVPRQQILSLIAGVYIGFAVADGRPRVIADESAVAGMSVVLAAAGVPAKANGSAGCAVATFVVGSARTVTVINALAGDAAEPAQRRLYADWGAGGSSRSKSILQARRPAGEDHLVVARRG
jgi:hypothetical protein